MNMRTIIAGLTLSAALVAGPAFAAQAFEGAWKEQHNNTPGVTTPANFKLTIWMKMEGGDLHYHSENTTQPDKPYISDHVSKLDGTVAPFPDQVQLKV